MAEIIRTERSSVLWAKESTFGTMVTPNKRFGIHETITAPDPDYKWTPFYGIGNTSRNRSLILRGPMDLRGSLPDIRLQSNATTRSLMAQVLGRESSNNVFEGQGVTDGRVPSMTMQVAYRDTSATAVLIRNFIGGKINKATLSAAETEELRLSIEEILFTNVNHNRSGVFGYNAAVSIGTDPGISDAGRYIFSGAEIQAFGMTICRARRFSLSIDNQLEYRYYLCNTGGSDKLQLPNDIVEGKRAYKLDLELDLGDPSTDLELFDYLMLQGATGTGSKVVGTTVVLSFTAQPSEGGGSFIIYCSPNSLTTTAPGGVLTSAKHNIPAPPAGLIPVTASMDIDAVSITVAT